MINWLIVLCAFCGGLAVTLRLAARDAAQPRARKFKWLALVMAGLAVGIGLWEQWGGGLTSGAGRVVSVQLLARTVGVEDPVASGPTVEPTASQLPSPTAVVESVERPDIAKHPLGIEAIGTPFPTRLRIPALGLDAPIVAVPIREGEWDLSELSQDIGWLATTGAHPGDDLAMVFIGHMTLSAVERGPFAYLQDIEKGAEVVYSSAAGDYIYEVEQLSRVQPDDVRQLYLPDPEGLLLITCTDWDSNQRLYASRLLVRAALAEGPGEDP